MKFYLSLVAGLFLSTSAYAFTFEANITLIDSVSGQPIPGRVEITKPRTSDNQGRYYGFALGIVGSTGNVDYVYDGDGGLDQTLVIVAASPGLYRPSPPLTVKMEDGGKIHQTFSLVRENWMITQIGDTLNNPDTFYRTIPNSGLCPNPIKNLTGWDIEDCNDAKMVSGYIYDETLGLTVPFYWNGSAAVELPQLDGVMSHSFPTAYALNNNGLIVGVGGASINGKDGLSAIRWRNGIAERFAMPAGATLSTAYDINERNEAVGYATINKTAHAILWRTLGEPTILDPGGNPLPGFTSSTGYVLNDSELVAGVIQAVKTPDRSGDLSHLFVWAPAQGMVDAGTLPGAYATFVSQANNRGDVVGTGTGVYRGASGFIYNQRDGMINVNHLLSPNYRATVSEADSINDSRQIVGVAYFNGSQKPFTMKRICPGDVNGDGVVDNGDAMIMRQNFSKTRAVQTDGDLNGDGVVDSADYVAWRTFLGTSYDVYCQPLSGLMPMGGGSSAPSYHPPVQDP